MVDIAEGQIKSMQGPAPQGVHLLACKQTIKEWIVWSIAFYIVAVSLILFFFYVDPSLTGENNLRIGADSNYYLWHAGLRNDTQFSSTGSDVSLISMNGSVLGPELFARALRSNFLILCANCALLLTTLCLFARAVPIRSALFVLPLLLNPSILVSILTLNKEIFVLLSVAMLCDYLASDTRSRIYLAAILLVAFFGRWQNLLAFIVFLVALRFTKAYRSRRWLTLLFVIACVTVLYPLVAGYVDIMTSEEQLESNTISILSAAQAHYLFFLVALPKIALNLFGDGLLLLWRGIKGIDNADIYAKYIIPISSLANIVVTTLFFANRRFSIRNDRLFFAAFYALLYSIPPFISCRYFFAIYIILALELATDDSHVSKSFNRNVSRLRSP